ncbi:MAG: guanylate kinase [Bacteroidales bacterium]
MSKGKLIIFSAPSGSGKSTIINHLLGCGMNLAFSVSATSRSPRGKEQNGREYYFMSPEEFRCKIAAGAFLEYEEVYKDNFYGTLKTEVERLRDEGKNVVFDIDVIGGLNLKKIFANDALSVFIMPPAISVLRERLTKRNTDSIETIEKRLAKAEYETSFAQQFDKIVVNDNLDTAKKEALSAISNFICKEKEND